LVRSKPKLAIFCSPDAAFPSSEIFSIDEILVVAFWSLRIFSAVVVPLECSFVKAHHVVLCLESRVVSIKSSLMTQAALLFLTLEAAVWEDQ
jgi:hypothetical protein